TVATSSPAATLRYTTDGNDPTAGSPPYTGPIGIATGTVLKVKGFRTGWTDSDTAAATYVFNYGTLAAPTTTPAAGTYISSVSVTLSAPAGTIRYTTDGSNPTGASPAYSSALTLTQTTTLKAAAFQADWTPSAPTAGTYEVK